MLELLSYECLQNIWFFIWGLLWAIYFILDGFDLGIGTLMPFIAQNETERRICYNCTGPFWDGNEVWLITAGGVTFAAFPLAYATMFSALYAPLLILLFALIFRAVSFEYRNKIDCPKWRTIADICQTGGSFLPALLLGVAFANLFQGIPITEKGVYMGNLFGLLNLYGLAGGVFFVLMFCLHGAIFLAIRTVNGLHCRAMATAKMLWPYLATITVIFLMATAHYTPLFDNYAHTPALMIIPILAVAALFFLRLFLLEEWLVPAFTASALFILFVTFFGIVGMFPNIIPSNLTPEASVTIARAASSHLTLTIMLVVSLLCVPVVIGYQAWVYWVFTHKLTKEDMESDHAY